MGWGRSTAGLAGRVSGWCGCGVRGAGDARESEGGKLGYGCAGFGDGNGGFDAFCFGYGAEFGYGFRYRGWDGYSVGVLGADQRKGRERRAYVLVWMTLTVLVLEIVVVVVSGHVICDDWLVVRTEVEGREKLAVS